MKSKLHLNIVVAGSDEFSRRIVAAFGPQVGQLTLHSGRTADLLSLCLTHRPHLILIEIGRSFNERDCARTREMLQRIRERDSILPYVAVALLASETLLYGGDLLFEEGALEATGLVDTFLVLPPPAMPSAAGLPAQLHNLLALAGEEIERRLRGVPPLPPLGTSGWVQSMADPASRTLWMRWLPRYASYTNENPLIAGATGTGKTNLALAVHQRSGRSGKFISMTPRDFSSSELIQAELFGAVAGAYTGAVDKWGLVKSAEGGTLFIDELQSIDKDLQGKLITFIENKVYRRVGSAESIRADVRFVFATNRPLQEMMQREVLRDDFAYRLERVQLELAPLVRRPLDIGAAIAFGMAKIERLRPYRSRVTGFTPVSYRKMFALQWPGNLRQLENVVAQLYELADMEEVSLIQEHMLDQLPLRDMANAAPGTSQVLADSARQLQIDASNDRLESLEEGVTRLRDVARQRALDVAAGDPAQAATLLGEPQELLQVVSQSIVGRKTMASDVSS